MKLSSIAWPAALGFLLGIGVILLLQTTAAEGSERLEPGGMAVILAVSAAIGTLVGAVVSWLNARRRSE